MKHIENLLFMKVILKWLKIKRFFDFKKNMIKL